MSSFVISGLTTITSITLADGWDNIGDFVGDVKDYLSCLNEKLPENRFLKGVIYGLCGLAFLRAVPFLLRKHPYFKYIEIRARYFHRGCANTDVMSIKHGLLKELREGTHNLPTVAERLVILELNSGGGTNLSYLPDGCSYMATDSWERAEELLSQNFNDEFDPPVHFERFILTIPEQLLSIPDNSVSAVLSIHSLCSSRDESQALLEILRVLRKDGKVYFIEHVREMQRFSLMWLAQLNFTLTMWTWDCGFKDLRPAIEKAGFSDVQLQDTTVLNNLRIGPWYSLRPHIFGYAKK